MLALVLIVLLLACGTAEADIYRFIDVNGTTLFTDSPVAGGVRVMKDRKAKPSFSRQSAAPSLDIENLIEAKCEEHGLDPQLVRAVIQAESNYNSQAVSPKGAMGLMQLMPQTASLMGVANPYNPAENIDGGVRYLRAMLDRFGWDLELALAAYNAGPTNVEKHRSVPPFRETRDYVKKILTKYSGEPASTRPASYKATAAKPAVTKKNTVIYKVVLEDGSVLYTNTIPQRF